MPGPLAGPGCPGRSQARGPGCPATAREVIPSVCTLSEPAAPSSTAQALAMVRAGLGYLSGCDAAELGTAGQAEALIGLEQAEAQHTAARAKILAAFSAQQGYQADGQYGPTAVAAGLYQGHQPAPLREPWGGPGGWQAHPLIADALAAGRAEQLVGEGAV